MDKNYAFGHISIVRSGRTAYFGRLNQNEHAPTKILLAIGYGGPAGYNASHCSKVEERQKPTGQSHPGTCQSRHCQTESPGWWNAGVSPTDYGQNKNPKGSFHRPQKW
jgi:hypothetical protein